MFSYFIGMGGNRGNRLHYLRQALDELSVLGEITGRSALYESAPYGVTGQGDFLNAAVRLQTGQSPHDLLKRIKAIEQALGRKPSQRWGPREIDLDILEYDGPPVHSDTLNIPHIELEKRRFVLEPLREIAPDFISRGGISLLALIRRCPDNGKLIRLEQSW